VDKTSVTVSIGCMRGNDCCNLSCVTVYWTGHVIAVITLITSKQLFPRDLNSLNTIQKRFCIREQEMVFSLSEVLVHSLWL
jgi:hypothetical protein